MYSIVIVLAGAWRYGCDIYSCFPSIADPIRTFSLACERGIRLLLGSSRVLTRGFLHHLLVRTCACIVDQAISFQANLKNKSTRQENACEYQK